MEGHAERSKLIGRQKLEKAELEKKVKKLKGAMKAAAQEELEELEKKHEAELVEFDATQGTGPAKVVNNEPEVQEEKFTLDELQSFRSRHWNGLSAKELEECCTERGLSKKGKKDDMIVRLIQFHQELPTKIADLKAAKQAALVEEEDEEDDEEEEERKKKKKEKKEKKKEKKEKKEREVAEGEEEEEEEEVDDREEKKKKEKKEKKEKKAKKVEEEEEEEEEAEEVEDEAEDSEDDEEDGLDVDREEMERQAKREEMVQKALRFLLEKKEPDGFPLSEFEAKLESINVRGFDPAKLGYRSIEKFVKMQPPNVLQYDKAKKFIHPRRRKGDE